MKIDKEFLTDHQVKLTVTMESEALEEARQRAARKIAQKTRIPGFRPGKAPYQVIVRTVGEGTVLEEALDILVNENYPKIIDEAEIEPYSSGSLEKVESVDPPTFIFVVPLEAEVTLGDFHAIRFAYELKDITDEDVDQTIEDLRDRFASVEAVDRAAQESDQVSVRLSAERKKIEEGKDIALIKDRPSPITINAEDDDVSNEWPFPGFSRKLLGLKIGDELSFDYTYSEDSVLESLRGTDAIFHVKVEEVSLRRLPEVDEKFAKNLGSFESVDELRQEIRNGMIEQSKTEYHREYDDKIMESILAEATIKYPPQMLEQEMNSFMRQLENRLAQQNLDMATYLKTRQMDEAALREELRPTAETRLKRSLVLYEIAQAEKIEVNEQEVQEQSIRTLNEVSKYYSPKDARKLVNNEFIQNIIGSITSDLLVDHTLEHLRKIARGEDVSKPASETETSEEKATDAAPEGEAEAIQEAVQETNPEENISDDAKE